MITLNSLCSCDKILVLKPKLKPFRAIFILVLVTFVVLLVLYYPDSKVMQNAGLTRRSGILADPSASRLRFQKVNHSSNRNEGKRAKEMGFVVDTETCKIPDLDPWDDSILHLMEPDRSTGYPADCTGSLGVWMYLKGTTLSMNETVIRDAGYSIESIYCCYRKIERVNQPLNDFDMDADNLVKLSESCIPIKSSRVLIDDADFIRVQCVSKGNPLFQDVIYRDYFALVQPYSDRLVSHKLESWREKKNSGSLDVPPNVVIIGIDNMSRLNSRRQLPKTLKVLQDLGAVELLGYTKVGENTFPNTVAFQSGYGEEELRGICYFSNEHPQDECPYAWKAFDKVGYLTVHAEDMALVGGFNYRKTGFLRKPTDFYLRPLMLTAIAYTPRMDFYDIPCIGHWNNEEVALKYMLDAVKLGHSTSAPVFVHSWLTTLAHRCYNNAQFGDDFFAKFVRDLVRYSNDETIFFFMSDHGQRFGEMRATPQGWYEDKLPTQWIYLPQLLRKKYPEWDRSLRQNANKLTSHFDLYKTMLHILREFDPEEKAFRFYNSSMSKKGSSLLEPIPLNRTCESAGIPVNYCPCSGRREAIKVDSEFAKEAAHEAIKYLRGELPLELCAEPRLKRIENAAILNMPPMPPVYLITIVTEPGDFLFEVTVERDVTTGKFTVTKELLRMNKISRPADCVGTPILERYCYCK